MSSSSSSEEYSGRAAKTIYGYECHKCEEFQEFMESCFECRKKVCKECSNYCVKCGKYAVCKGKCSDNTKGPVNERYKKIYGGSANNYCYACINGVYGDLLKLSLYNICFEEVYEEYNGNAHAFYRKMYENPDYKQQIKEKYNLKEIEDDCIIC